MSRRIDPFKALLDSLRKLPDVGEDGFEGMLRDNVAKVADRHLRLVKSGPQGGVDMATDVSNLAPTIAVEAKRYGGRSALPLDQLKAKLVDAVHQRPDLDLIAIGATREISRGDQDTLVDLGDQMGIGVVVIDWPNSATELPPLAVLCALASKPLLDRIDRDPEVESSLEAVRNHADFAKAGADIVRRLTKPDLGWSAARRSMTDWLREAFASRNAALGKLGSLVNLLDANAHRVSRPRLNAALDRWWESRGGPLALLGEEGVGKSWAPLGWWHEKAGPDGTGLPLTLMIPAREVADADAEMLVPRLLARRIDLRNENFWRRRVALWLKTPTDLPRFLLIFDGLNEHWTFRSWDQVLAQLAADPWADKTRVILTCRPDHWTQELHDFASVLPTPVVQSVGPFDDGELDGLLALHGLSRDDFVPNLLPLLKVPRLCDLAIRHRAAMAESGDITPERLIYEDWKDRLGRKGARLPIGDAEFKEFIAKLGRRLHGELGEGVEPGLSLTRHELTAELGADSGRGPDSLYATVSEIVDGRWMESVPGRANQFRLNKDLMPFGLGMALVNTLKEAPEAGLSDRLAEFIEPLGEQDSAVTLLRAAVTFALIDFRCSVRLRRLLVDSWLRRQNFREIDFEAFWRLLPSDANLFFSLAEEQWLHRHARHHEDEILIKGFANAAERWQSISQQVVTWCAAWLGTHWGDPLKGMVLNYDPNEQGVAGRREQTRERRAEWEAVAGSLIPPIPIRDGLDGDIAWLACRVLGILSYLPRAPFIPAIAAWAVSRAIMGKAPQFDQVAWILRLPYADDAQELREAVQREARRLQNLDRPVATEAARLLLEALGTPDAARQAEALRSKMPPPWTGPSTVTVDEISGTLHWDHEAAGMTARSDKPSLSAVRDLSRYAINPDRHMSVDDAAVLRELADVTDAASLWRGMGRTSDDIALEEAEAALARWAPGALGAMYRRLFVDARSRTGEALNQLGFQTPAHLLVLTENERAAMVASAGQSSGDEKRGDWARVWLRLAQLAERSASEQIAAFREWPNGPNFDRSHRRILATPNREDFVRVAGQLRPDAPTQWLCGWLWYLSHVPLDALPAGYPALIPLLNHPEVEVRRLALEVVYKSCDPQLAAALRASQWRWAEGMDREESMNGSLALIGATGERKVAEIRERIVPEARGLLAIRDDATKDDLDAFATFVRWRIEEDFVRRRSSRTLHSSHFLLNQPVDRLVADRSDQVVSWLQPVLSDSERPRFGFFMETFPYIDLCRALLCHRPTDGAALWRVMREHYDRDIVRTDSFALLPFEVPDSDPVFGLRDLACEKAATDEDLGKIATSVVENNRQGWLIDRIHRELDGASAGQMARGLWLAGLLDATPAADELWRGILSQPPAPGWLASVHERARHLYQRNSWAHQWLEEFLAERDRDRAFGGHLLFVRSADHRAFGWAPKCVGNVWSDLPKSWQTHWSLCWPELKAAVEKRDKEWKQTLFGSKITAHIQWPWR
jgi:hypothetical protein